MKILASPFESAREPVAIEAPEAARLEASAEATNVAPPAATTEIQSGLDSTTRDSLSRLAMLVRNQTKSLAVPESKASPDAPEDRAKREELNQDSSKHDTPNQDRPNQDPPNEPRANATEQRISSETDRDSATEAGIVTNVFSMQLRRELPSPQAVSRDLFPAIIRLERTFEKAARERGVKIYRAQKTKDAVQMIMSELERRQELELASVDQIVADADLTPRGKAA